MPNFYQMLPPEIYCLRGLGWNAMREAVLIAQVKEVPFFAPLLYSRMHTFGLGHSDLYRFHNGWANGMMNGTECYAIDPSDHMYDTHVQCCMSAMREVFAFFGIRPHDTITLYRAANNVSEGSHAIQCRKISSWSSETLITHRFYNGGGIVKAHVAAKDIVMCPLLVDSLCRDYKQAEFVVWNPTFSEIPCVHVPHDQNRACFKQEDLVMEGGAFVSHFFQAKFYTEHVEILCERAGFQCTMRSLSFVGDSFFRALLHLCPDVTRYHNGILCVTDGVPVLQKSYEIATLVGCKFTNSSRTAIELPGTVLRER